MVERYHSNASRVSNKEYKDNYDNIFKVKNDKIQPNKLLEFTEAKRLCKTMTVKQVAKKMNRSEDWVRQAKRENTPLQKQQQARSLIFKNRGIHETRA